jgi:hypothetical protein
MILAIDPGNKESAYAVLNDNLRPVDFAKFSNEQMRAYLIQHKADIDHMAIEMVGHYGTGMPAGKEIFDTCVWIGRYIEIAPVYPQLILRKTVVANICGTAKAKDSNVRQALIDRFGDVGVKAKPGWFYGVAKDVWSSVAVGVTYNDLYLKGG